MLHILQKKKYTIKKLFYKGVMANVARAAHAAKLLQQEAAVSSKPLISALKDGLGSTRLPTLNELTVNISNSPLLE